MVISSIGYKVFKVVISEFENGSDFLEDVASLDEAVIVADHGPQLEMVLLRKPLKSSQKTFPSNPTFKKDFFGTKSATKRNTNGLLKAPSLYTIQVMLPEPKTT